MPWIDLTLPLSSEMPAFPGDTTTRIGRVEDFVPQGWQVSHIHMSLHCGTHVEAGAHAISGGRTLDSYPPESFLGEARCIPREELGKVKPDVDILLIYTGWDKLFPPPEYARRGLELSPREARWLAEQRLKAVGTDTLSIGNREAHQAIFGSGSLILEGLSHLELVLGKRFRLYFLPLRVSEEASPVRAVAELRE